MGHLVDSPVQRAKGGANMLKVQLVVTAAGPNQGRAIPLTSAKFMIGRDPDCQLRPASQAVSKKHCAIEVRDGKVYVADIGSTNGSSRSSCSTAMRAAAT